MKRIITLFLAVAMLAGVIMLAVACGGDNSSTTTTSGKTTTTNTNGTTTNPSGQTTTQPSGQTTTEPSGETTTNPSGTTTTPGGAEPIVEWDGKTKLPGKENVDFGGRTFFIASCDQNDGYDTTNEVWVEALTNESYNDSVFE